MRKNFNNVIQLLNGRGKLILMGVIGILVAAAIIGGVSQLNLPSGSSTVTTSVTTFSTKTSTTVYTSTKISISKSTVPEGTLATQIADLLSLPSGVTHVYVDYSDIEVHTTLANASIWLRVAPQDNVDLTALSGNGVTVGISNISAGYYDSARFTIDSAIVTFQGKNVTAIVPDSAVSVPILQNGIDLLPNATSGLLVDIAPSVVPTQSPNGTQIELLPYAEALAIPSSVPTSQYVQIGSVIPLETQPWFTSTQVNLANNMTVLAALVTSNALLVVVKNTGNSSITINGMSLLEPSTSSLVTQTIVSTITTVTTITTIIPSSQTALPSAEFPSSSRADKGLELLTTADPSNSSNYQTVATFLVLYNGQVVQPSTGVNPQQLGLVLSPGQNASLTFIGKIQTLNSLSPVNTPLQIVPGAQYILEMEGPFGQSEDINVSAISPF